MLTNQIRTHGQLSSGKTNLVMRMGGIAYTREHVFQVLEICTAINSLEVINTAGGNIPPGVV